MPKLQILSYEQAKRFYDWMGAKQDTQCFYERQALADLVAHLELAGAEKVIEFGCGTGRLTEELFDQYLPLNACYVGLDVSSTMIALAQSRTARFGRRAAIQQTSGTMRVDLPDAAFDRFISTYVLDLLSEEDIDSLLRGVSRPCEQWPARRGQLNQRVTRPIALCDLDLATITSVLADSDGWMSTDHNQTAVGRPEVEGAAQERCHSLRYCLRNRGCGKDLNECKPQ
jgi:SAM-dependent methyltransferase